ncbi:MULTISPECIES: phosphomannomutase [Marivita]|uniref:Phosphomannomutase n=2 Tax=Marivita cryptomonadis TaxID=505252 RepID=A0A9Q2P2N8_9RHOB|nr:MULTISPECIES: phosphomannomutase [Marivita]MBM2324187.1 phosphomannomutase [Marivita cryptomonadis]MBM2333777.1 phosphomannomutase [Marivita cryptomonadis]MBM2343354.1 phosphomannomutase [Marivita cryptomonadis]MBM2348026.1 phosphomannomutase [Marivita cryptomonadis]MBM2352707.1 phosphomannomutase [Marivita cryptomonadis]
MPPKFGTSGLRGLVTELTDEVITAYTSSFLKVCPHGGAVHIARDLRSSSPKIAKIVSDVVQKMGVDVVDHGAIPTPALALVAIGAGQAAIMVTGSHIPADRNGLKFYSPTGEISKSTETKIVFALNSTIYENKGPVGNYSRDKSSIEKYINRYINAFGSKILSGMRIGVYEHSSVSRDSLKETLLRMGADIISLERTEKFVSVDTEAIDNETKTKLHKWCAMLHLDAIVSTDGDGDRPLIADSQGNLIPGDIIGPLAAQVLGANVICTPVSSNTAVDHMGFSQIIRTKIGSPFVIEAMETADGKVVGYEANGGFLLGFNTKMTHGKLHKLMTRDSFLPIITSLTLMHKKSKSLNSIISELPSRFTASGRLQDISTETGQNFITKLSYNSLARSNLFSREVREHKIDLTDGLRVFFEDGVIIHLRPSGNSPEFRCYVEAQTLTFAEKILQSTCEQIASHISVYKSTTKDFL